MGSTSASSRRCLPLMIFSLLLLEAAAAYNYKSRPKPVFDFEDEPGLPSSVVETLPQGSDSSVASSFATYADVESSQDAILGQVISAGSEGFSLSGPSDAGEEIEREDDDEEPEGIDGLQQSVPSPSIDISSRMGVFTPPRPVVLPGSLLFNRPLCRTPDDTRGVCHQRFSCRFRGGKFRSVCAGRREVCCVFEHSCSVTTKERLTYYRNPSFPKSDSGNLICNYKVDVAPKMCGVRLDFLNYSTPILGKCVDTQLSYLIGNDTRTTPVCGVLKGTSATIPAKSEDGPVVLSHVLGGNVPYLFNIRVTQLRCSSVKAINESACGRRNDGLVRHKRSARVSAGVTFIRTPQNSAEPSEETFTINSTENSSPWNNFPYDYLKEFEVKDKFSSSSPITRIIGGAEALVNQWPWQVALMKRKNLTSRALSFYCGGVLINKDFVVTAAHCVTGFKSFNYTDVRKHIVVSLGDHDLRTLREAKPVFRGVKKIVVHHQWDQHRNVHDIALIQLSRPVNYTGAVTPACLPTTNRSMAGKTIHISGWGVTSFNGSRPGGVSPVLKTVDVTGVGQANCDKVWKKFDNPRTIWPEFQPVSEQKVCVGTRPGAACFGDSGGPATFQEENGRFTLVGVTSYGPPICTIGGLPTIYTRISQYLDWINLTIVQLFESDG